MIYVGFEIEIEGNNRNNSNNIDKLIDKTTHITGWNSRHGILDYHRSKPYVNAGKWGVEHDSSLLDGAEFITPPEEKDDALHVLERFLSNIEESGCATLNSCGLHLNISANNKTIAGMNKSYFLSNINQRLLYALWGDRLKGTNTYCIPMKKVLEYTHILSTLDTEIQNRLLIGKYRYVNRKITDGFERLEIRVMGGVGYHRKIKEITTTTNMFCDLLEESYKKSQPKSKKRIVSYINRIQKRNPKLNSLWTPAIGLGAVFDTETFFYYHNRIKNTLEHTDYTPEDIEMFLHRKYYDRVNVWEAYCNALARHLQRNCTTNSDANFIKKAAQKINKTYYYIFKYLDKVGHEISDRMFTLYLNGQAQIIDDYKALLTVPKDEGSVDVIWLCKYDKKLSEEAKTVFVDSLSLSALRFIKKKNIIPCPKYSSMNSIINRKIKKLVEEKQA